MPTTRRGADPAGTPQPLPGGQGGNQPGPSPTRDDVFTTPSAASAINIAAISTQVAATSHILNTSANQMTVMQDQILQQNSQISLLTQTLSNLTISLSNNASPLRPDQVSHQTNFFAKPSIDSFINKVTILDISIPEKVVEFIVDTQHLIDINFLPLEMLLKSLINRCALNAQAFWASCIASSLDWEAIKNNLLEIYIPPLTRQLLVDKLVRRTQPDTEKFSTFAASIIKFSKILLKELSEAQIIEIIFAHANTAILTIMGLNQIPETYNDLSKLITKMEEIQSRMLPPIQIANASTQQRTNSTNKYFCTFCKGTNHDFRHCFKRINKDNGSPNISNPKN